MAAAAVTAAAAIRGWSATPGLTAALPKADLALRIVAVAFLLGGALIGFGHPAAIVLVVLGLLVLIADQALKRRPHKPAH